MLILSLLCVVVDGKMGRIGGGSMRFAAVVVFIVEVVLSHQGGEKSGEESAWLARTTGIKEGLLRGGAHVFLFSLLSVFSALGFGPWAFVFCFVWSVADEWTKRRIRGRHFSWIDVGLNLAGVAVGVGLWLVLR